ncbi:hypothetical protein D5F01_LYC12201 [Larimichthys crocea]|uniref:Transposase element L1Md-A101/L1Md-A102/L1Md-A2 n=1 Tax=Larimichthys crocea TaxID=215358 RepID=A0A6G0IA88_LARCR|nr:hypothetical protein D5F01_LYC12201 [Larimichthys crocea]
MMSKKVKCRKTDQPEAGPDQPSDSSESPIHTGRDEEPDPSNRAVLAAITALRDEVTRIKNDICSSIDARIQIIYTELKEELVTMKRETQKSITALEETTASQGKTITEIEKSASFHSDEVTTLRRQVTRLNSEVEKLTGKCEDLEGRSRRHNIRIIGVPEGAEGPRPRDFIAGLLQDALSLEDKPLIDRAHRTLRKKPDPHEPPRPFVLRLHYFHVLEDILRRASVAKQLHYGGKRIQIFPDYPPAVAKRRALFNRSRELLRNIPGVRYGLLYPARLLITYDGKQTSFTDPTKAEEYAEQLPVPGSSSSGQVS